MKTLLLLILIGFVSKVGAQNLVPNPSFENYSTCITSFNQVPNYTGWVGYTSPDGFNSCATAGFMGVPSNIFGNQNANTGNGYVGFITRNNHREYIQCQLLSPMIAGQTYCVSLYVNLAEQSAWASDNGLEIHFGNVLPPTGITSNGVSGMIGATPQIQFNYLIDDKVNWVQLTTLYTAVGGEQFMTIGNFKDNTMTNFVVVGGSTSFTPYSYVFADDISVTPINDATINPIGIQCLNSGSINLTAVDPGGTWSGAGITDVNLGTFDPLSAGLGTHTITYSISGTCGDTKTQDIVVSNCVLPVELLEFDAQAVDHRKVELTWTTASEINNDFFEIERSKDGITFNTIAWVNGAGNSNVKLHYNELDLDPYNGISYYRLKQTDFDGKYTFSDIRTVTFDDLSFVDVYPNPVGEELKLMVTVDQKTGVQVHILDMMGRSIMQENHWVQSGQSTITLNTTNLASGMYTIRVNTNDENHLSKEFIRR